jgi:L-lactate dehydrogenase (cytochrome)
MKELLSGSLFSKISNLPQILARSVWSASFVLDGGVPKLENIVVPGQGPMPLMDVTAALGKSAVT